MTRLPALTPLQQMIVEHRALYSRVNVLEQRKTNLPMLNTDPPANSGINVWILTDGRIHMRLPNGTVKELAGAATTGSSSTSPVAPPAAKVTQTTTFYPTWTQCYTKGGSAQYGTATLYYGYYRTPQHFYDQTMSILTFPSTIVATIGTSSVNWMKFYGTSARPFYKTGSTVHIGGGFYGSTAPSTYNSGFENEASKLIPAAGGFFVSLPSYFWQPFQTGTINGITLNSPDTSVSNFGAVSGIEPGSTVSNDCRLVVNYTL